MPYDDMTPAALACRADDVRDYLVADFLCNGDERELTVFLVQVDCELDPPDDGWTVPGVRLEVIGATVADEVLTRDELRDLIGDRAVAGFETSFEYDVA